MPTFEIPGFYFDEERRKYFKIQPSHLAPAGSKFTQESLKRQAEQTGNVVSSERESGRQIKRSKILHHALGGSFGLETEVCRGADSKRLDNRYSAWARGLMPRPCVFRGADQFVYDEATASFYYSRARNRRLIDFAFKGTDTRRDPNPIDLATSRIVSINLSPSRVLLSTAMGGRCAGLTLTALPEPETFSQLFRALSLGIPLADHPVSQASQKLYLPDSTFWASSPRPHPTTPAFAVAASRKVVRVYVREGFDWTIEPEYVSSTGSDALAVDWLDTNVVLSGHRDGTVVLWDTRSTGKHSRSQPLCHSSSITHVRRLNQSKIVVAGLKDQLATYDLRFPSTTTTTTTTTPKISPSPSRTPTKPYLTFPTHRNYYQPGHNLGFDVYPFSSSGGLIASACDRPAGNPVSQYWAPAGAERSSGGSSGGGNDEPSIPVGESVQVFDAGTGKALPLGRRGRGAERDAEVDGFAEFAAEYGLSANGGGAFGSGNTNGGGSSSGSGRRDGSTPPGGRRGEGGGEAARGDFGRPGHLVTCLKFSEGGLGGLSLMVGSAAGIEEWCWS